jgi:hypothetical protein
MTTRARRNSIPIALAIGAALVVAAGSATAATAHHSSGNALISKHSLSGDRLKTNTVTGSQVKESTLGTVPAATSAKTVDGFTVKKIFFTGAPDTAPHVIFNVDGLDISAGCSGSAPTLSDTIPDAEFHVQGLAPNPYSIDQASAGTEDMLKAHFQGSLRASYATFSGHVISLDMAFDRASTFGTHNVCTVYGTALID